MGYTLVWWWIEIMVYYYQKFYPLISLKVLRQDNFQINGKYLVLKTSKKDHKNLLLLSLIKTTNNNYQYNQKYKISHKK